MTSEDDHTNAGGPSQRDDVPSAKSAVFIRRSARVTAAVTLVE